jgi:chemotaxis signal transduction protein
MTTVVCFRTGDGHDEYALPVDCVREVCSADALQPLPGAKTGVAGFLSYEGRTLTVVTSLGTGERQVLLLERGDRSFGILVDEVTRVVDVGAEVGPPPRGQGQRYISGVVATDAGIVLLVDVDALDEGLGT